MPKARVESLDKAKHTGTARILGRRPAVRFSLTDAAVETAPGQEVLIALPQDEPGALARVVMPVSDVLRELQAQRLVGDLNMRSFAALTAEALGPDASDEGLDGPEILALLHAYYGREDEASERLEAQALERVLRDRILVFSDSHEIPELVAHATKALADALGLTIQLPEESDFNDAFDALGDALEGCPERAFLLPTGYNESAILVRDALAPARLRLFRAAERSD